MAASSRRGGLGCWLLCRWPLGGVCRSLPLGLSGLDQAPFVSFFLPLLARVRTLRGYK